MYPPSLMYGMFGSFYDVCAYVLYLCFPVGHKKPSVGSGDNMTNIFIMEFFIALNNVNIIYCVILLS